MIPVLGENLITKMLSSTSILRFIGLLSLRQTFLKPADDKPNGILNGYADGHPSAQENINLISGWNTAFPPEYKLIAGETTLYNDNRILWAIEQYGSLEEKRILELGPLEASHTYMFENENAAEIVAIEANKEAFLRCLIAKEIYRLKKSHFLIGDFVKYLEETEEHFDIIVASGVLYHMKDPIRLLELICQKSDAIFLWTHYFDEDAMPQGDLRRVPFTDEVVTKKFQDIDVKLHARSYYNAWKSDAFCGGPENIHFWMEKDQIIAIANRIGFSDVRISLDQSDHQNGPCCMMYLSKK